VEPKEIEFALLGKPETPCIGATPPVFGVFFLEDNLTKYTQREDGEGFEVPSGQVYKIACCDCGLVHDFMFVSHDGKPIGVAAKRNNRATGQKRRYLNG
jgi:hypothetical protein